MNDNTIMLQTEIGNGKSIAKVRCWTCNVDYFEVIEKGKNKDLLCKECKEK